MGTVSVNLSALTAGAFDGGQIYIDGVLEQASVSSPNYRFELEEGPRTFRFEKECASVTPAAEVTVDVQAGGDRNVAWIVGINGGVEVTSNVDGAAIWLDDEDTGLVTPATLECVPVGTHEVQLVHEGFIEEAPQTIEVSDDVLRVTLDLSPAEQTRGALVEILTATECPNCLPVDEAAEDIWRMDQARVDAGAVTVQVHHPWAGESDPFFNDDTFNRNIFYGARNGGHPIRMINGIVRTVGAGDGDIERIRNQIRGEVDPFLAGDQGGPHFALYWSQPEYTEGMEVRATLRVVVLEAVENPEETQVFGMNYKHNLITYVRLHDADEPFYRVIRNIDSAGTCVDLGLLERGDWAEFEYVFDLSGDTEWHEDGMGVVGFVQDLSTKEIYNVRHAYVP